MAIFGAPFSHWCVRGAVGVFDKFAGRPGVAETGVDRDVRIDAEQTAERKKFVGAHIIRLHRMPHGIEDERSLVDLTDTIAPLIRGDKVASRKAQDPKTQLLERRDDLRAEAVD